jgi:tetratricopeptide (TPR) repeat protein
VADLVRARRLGEARAALGRAEGRLAGGGPADLVHRVHQMRDDLSLVDALDRIRLQAATVVEGQFDCASAERDYAALFQEHGLAAEGEDPAAAAARIGGSAVRALLVAALDDWAALTADRPRRAWLLEVARRAEPSAWGDRFRDPAVWRERAALERLAAEAGVAELSPQLLTALGLALSRSGADPVPLWTAAQARHPADFWLNFHLGNVLVRAKPEEAIGYYRAALAVRPDTSAAHYNLGTLLYAQGRLDDAIREYRRAIDLDSKLARPHNNLGLALQDQGRLGEAIREYRTALALDPKDANAHSNLGGALYDQGRLGEAIQEHRTALALDPKLAQAHGHLGRALLEQGRFAEARASTRRFLDLLPPNHPQRRLGTQQLRQCECLLALADRLPALLKGEAKPTDAAERLALAQLCQQYKQLYAAAARFYADAFAEEPRLAEDLQEGHRYNAACAAARAGAGEGIDAPSLDDPEPVRLRAQALGWLQADLAAWTKLLEAGPPDTRARVRQTLQHWQHDPDLAGLRDAVAVAQLPAGERQACGKLWADVEALLRRAREKAP